MGIPAKLTETEGSHRCATLLQGPHVTLQQARDGFCRTPGAGKQLQAEAASGELTEVI